MKCFEPRPNGIKSLSCTYRLRRFFKKYQDAMLLRVEPESCLLLRSEFGITLLPKELGSSLKVEVATLTLRWRKAPVPPLKM